MTNENNIPAAKIEEAKIVWCCNTDAFLLQNGEWIMHEHEITTEAIADEIISYFAEPFAEDEE